MKTMMSILVLALVISGCDDMKMDKKVATHITLEPVYDLFVTYFPKQHLVKKLEGTQIICPFIC